MAKSDMDQRIDDMVREFVSKLTQLTEAPYLREGAVKEAVAAVIWDTVFEMPDERFALAEALEHIPDAIRDWTPGEAPEAART